MSKTALVILAEGAEEMELVITVDVLRRAEIDVTVAGLAGGNTVKCSRGVFVKPDVALQEVVNKQFDIVILPGGLKGAQSIADSPEVGKILKVQEEAKRFIGAICAAPALALPSHKIGEGKTVTSYPALKDKLASLPSYKYSEDRVVVDGTLITSRGPGTAFEFALAIVGQLCGSERIAALKQQMLVLG